MTRDHPLDDPAQLEVLLRTLRRVEAEPSLLGASPHLNASAGPSFWSPR